jgi:hypothetical protein
MVSDSDANAVATDWGGCYCDEDDSADDGCDCDGNLPDIECGEGTALAGDMVCFESECAGISYNVYRDDNPIANPIANV